MKSNFDNRLTRIEKTIDEILNPYAYEERIILVNVSAGETKEGKIAELEKELGREISKGKIIFLIISGITKI
ncbi:MAG: hypothetical protein WCA84_11855 [Ignavibacteriaceae bacterium]